jgi:hypothetical protein
MVSNKKTEALEQAQVIEGILCGKWEEKKVSHGDLDKCFFIILFLSTDFMESFKFSAPGL